MNWLKKKYQRQTSGDLADEESTQKNGGSFLSSIFEGDENGAAKVNPKKVTRLTKGIATGYVIIKEINSI